MFSIIECSVCPFEFLRHLKAQSVSFSDNRKLSLKVWVVLTLEFSNLLYIIFRHSKLIFSVWVFSIFKSSVCLFEFFRHLTTQIIIFFVSSAPKAQFEFFRHWIGQIEFFNNRKLSSSIRIFWHSKAHLSDWTYLIL